MTLIHVENRHCISSVWCSLITINAGSIIEEGTTLFMEYPQQEMHYKNAGQCQLEPS
jgi:hypothetical protein